MAGVLATGRDQMEDRLFSLAHEIAADIHPLGDILRFHGVSPAEWDRLQTNPRFQQLLQQKVVEWNSGANALERLRAKYGASLELHAANFHRMLDDTEVPAKDRIELAKFMARIAFGEKLGAEAGQGGQGGSGFNLTIQITGKEAVVIDGKAEAIQPKVIEVE